MQSLIMCVLHMCRSSTGGNVCRSKCAGGGHVGCSGVWGHVQECTQEHCDIRGQVYPMNIPRPGTQPQLPQSVVAALPADPACPVPAHSSMCPTR